MDPIKLRMLRAEVIEAGSAVALQAALLQFYQEQSDNQFELVSIVQVAEYAVLITYTG